jgi:hypothetical protein
MLQSCYKGTVFPVAIQSTVATPQHRLYFLPEPHGHGSFLPTLEALRRASGLKGVIALASRCSLRYW